jgi:hypothetical protein
MKWSLRQILFALLLAGIVGLAAELLLLEHTESWTQWIPLVVLPAGFVSSMWLLFRPGPLALKTFQVIMGTFVMAGVAGFYFHYAGNVEFAVERDSALSGARLVWEALRGATPSLAPGALAQLGLLGLAYTYAHPASQRTVSGDS